MKIFAYSVREDEVKYFEKMKIETGADISYTSEYPSMENIELAKGADGVLIITNVITKDMYDAWASYGVKYIGTRSVGFDHMDTKYMKDLGMRGLHAVYSPNAVANYTIMLMLMACRKVTFILDKAKVQDFALPGKIGKELSLCTVGVIGTGQIGETVIRHLSGFGCRILAYDLYEKESVKEYAEYVDLDTLYKECDVITLHVPGSEENYHMINEETIGKMKDDVILINAARGSVVDSQALIAGLESGKIGFAALDTFEEEFGLYYKNLEREQIVNRTRLILQGFPNVILSPHMAFYTEQSTSDMVRTPIVGMLEIEKDGESTLEVSYV